MLFSQVASAVGLFAAGVSAHGAVTSYVIDGKTYPGLVAPDRAAPLWQDSSF